MYSLDELAKELGLNKTLDKENYINSWDDRYVSEWIESFLKIKISRGDVIW